MSFEVLPVNDPANLTVQNVTGQEDGSVSLGAGASLIDNDGSEQIVGLQIRGCRMASPCPPRRSTTAVGCGRCLWAPTSPS